jgi:hypothetical protein
METMKDKNHIEMEDISSFPLERSLDFLSWEKIPYQDLLENVLKDLDDDYVHRLCRVIRGGSPFKLSDYYYRIKSN